MKLRIIILLISALFSCQKKSNKIENKISEKSLKMDEELTILKEQLKKGTNPIIGYAIDFQNVYSDKDIMAEESIVTDILRKSGYKIISKEEFKKRLNEIFNRTIDYTSNKNYLYINLLNPCDRNMIYYKNNLIDYNGFIIFKNLQFISDLYLIPELIDYSKKYPEINNFEENLPLKYKNNEGDEITIIKWKDVVNLNEQRYFNQQLLVHRNKYLFNDNKASFGWLKFNDEYFLESLVKVFGYTKDKDLLAWVMKRNEEEAKAEEFINSFLFVRNCKGEMEIRDGILKYIEENTTDNEKSQNFVSKLGSYYVESPNYSWTEKERFKIIAYIANTYDYLYKKSSTLGNTNKGRISFLGSIFFRSNKNDNEKSWNELIKNFKENNYYHLPHLQEAVDHAYEYENFEL